MTSIELSKEQSVILSELNTLMGKLSTELGQGIDHTDGEMVAYRLMRRIELHNLTPRIMELATVIYDHCKGLVADEAMKDERVLNLKQDVQRKYFEGRLAKWSALYVKCEMACKELDRGIDGLRSILSREKELMKNNAA